MPIRLQCPFELGSVRSRPQFSIERVTNVKHCKEKQGNRTFARLELVQ